MGKQGFDSSTDHSSYQSAEPPRDEGAMEWIFDDRISRLICEMPPPPALQIRATCGFALNEVDIVAVTNDLQRWLG
jgi:hypothetical protein